MIEFDADCIASSRFLVQYSPFFGIACRNCYTRFRNDTYRVRESLPSLHAVELESMLARPKRVLDVKEWIQSR